MVKVLFFDEFTKQQIVPRHMHIRRPFRQEICCSHNETPAVPNDLGCPDAAGLYFIPPNTAMNGPKYVELLKEKLKLHMYIHGCTIFMQDGAPCHRSKVATEFLKKNEISVLE